MRSLGFNVVHFLFLGLELRISSMGFMVTELIILHRGDVMVKR